MSQPRATIRDRVMLVFLSLSAGSLGISLIWGLLTGDILGTGDILPFWTSGPLAIVNLFLSGITALLAFVMYVLPVLLPLFAAHAYPERERATIVKRCAEVDRMLAEGSPSAQKNAIITMDSLLDHALKTLGYQGSMADKLKTSGNRFKDIEQIWQAHKFRNRVVHEVDARFSSGETRATVETFKTALRDLRALD